MSEPEKTAAAADGDAGARLVGQLQDDQRARWQSGERVLVEAYLQRHPTVQDDAEIVLRLIYNETLLREERGETPRLEEYVRRFPQLAPQLRDQFEVHQALAYDPLWEDEMTLRAGALAPPVMGAPPARAEERGAQSAKREAPSAEHSAPGAPRSASLSRGTHIRCPHCHNPIHLSDNRPDEVLCPACGSSFHVRETRQTTPTAPMRQLGKFQLLERVGVGAFGAVWRARDTQLDRIVALKIPHASLLASAPDLERFHREARAAAKLRHPGIVTVHEVQTLEGLPTIVSDFINGVPLNDLLEVRRLTFREAATLVADVAEAVDYAHAMGLVHRDLKPANIMVESVEENPKFEEANPNFGSPVSDFGFRISDFALKPLVMDFGLALGQEAELTLTLDGVIVGTPAYMSPEQAAGKGHAADRRSDVYSLGVILYELLCGELPFRGSRLMMLYQVQWEDPRLPRRLNDKIPRDLETICLKAMAKLPARRYGTARELADDLRRFLAGEPVRARPVGSTERLWRWCRRNPAVATLTGFLAALLVLLAIGSTTAALWLKAADRQKTEKLFESLLAQARGQRLSRRVGQRFESLRAVTDAVKIARELKLPESRFLELRNEVIACLALPDLRVAREWDLPAGAAAVVFDGALERYARRDKQGTISIRRVADDEEIYRLPDTGVSSWGLHFSPDGQFLLVWGQDGMKLWRLAGQKSYPLGKELRPTAFSLDSRQFAVGLQDGSVDLYDLASVRRVSQLKVDGEPLYLAFHPTDRRLAIAFRDRVRVYELDTENKLADLPLARYEWPYLVWHPEGKVLAAVGGDRIIYLWDVATGKQTTKLEGCKVGGIAFTFNHAGDRLVSRAWDGMVRLWDPHTGKQLFHTPVTQLCENLTFSPDDRFLAAEVISNKLRIWQVDAGREYRTPVTVETSGDTAVSPNGCLLAAGTLDGFGLWDLGSGRELCFIRLGGPTRILFDGSGSLLTGGANGVCRWPIQAEAASVGRMRIGPPQPIGLSGPTDLAGSTDRQVIASPRGWGALVLHTDRPGRPITLAPHDDVRYVAVSPDGRWVVTGSHDSRAYVKVWEAETGRLAKDLFAGVGQRVAFSPNGQWLATSGDAVRVWEVGSWREGPRFEGPPRLTVTFSPDSKMLAFETGYGVVRLVDPESGREWARLEDPNQEGAGGITFTPDGTQLLTTTGEPAVHVWDLRAIRVRLAAMGLDWDLPPYPPVTNSKPPLREVKVELGSAFSLLTGRDRTSIGLNSLLLALNPFNAEAYWQRGRAYAIQGEPANAVADYTMVLALLPPQDSRRAEVLFQRSANYERLDNNARALADLQQIVRLDLGEFAGLHADLASVCNRMARQLLTGPENEWDPAQALPLAQKAVTLTTPEVPMYLNTLGVAYYRLGRYEQAIETLERSLRGSQGEDAADNLFFLALCHSQRGELGKAKLCYERGVQCVKAWQDRLPAEKKKELDTFSAEAEALLRQQAKH